MTAITAWNNILNNLTWTLIYSLWQVPLIAVVLLILLRAIPTRRPEVRYLAGVVSLAGAVLVGMLTFAVLTANPQESLESPGTATIPSPKMSIEGKQVVRDYSPSAGQVDRSPSINTSYAVPIEPTIIDWPTVVACLWLVGVALMSIRLVMILRAGRRLRTGATIIHDPQLIEMLETSKQALGLARRIELRIHPRLTVPAVVGIIRPMILLPLSAMTGLPPEHMQAILLHELAHVRRYDLLVQIGQLIVETLLFFNPAAWWISRRIRIEREACADVVAARHTGESEQYVQIISDWGRRLVDHVSIPPTAATVHQHGNGSLLDRANRLLSAGYCPRVRLPWPSLVIAMISGAALLVGFYCGTDAAVSLAAEILTPEERMEQLIEEESKHAPYVSTSDAEKNQVTLTGKITTADGAPVINGHIKIRSRSANHSNVKAASLQQPNFTLHAEFGAIWVMAKAKGYASRVVGPFRGEPSGSVNVGKIVLSQGFHAFLKFVDEKGKPLERVKVKAMWQFASGAFIGIAGRWFSDGDGVAELKHLAKGQYIMTATKSGYEPARRKNVQLEPDRRMTWILHKAKPLQGLVVDKGGQPIADVKVRMIYDGNLGHGLTGPILAQTDRQGDFSLDSLDSEVPYTFCFEHTEHGQRMCRGVKVADGPLNVKLTPLVLHGRVVGDLSRLKRNREGQPIIRYQQKICYAMNHVWTTGYSDIRVNIKQGVAYFEVINLVEGGISIIAGGHTRQIELSRQNPPDEVVIDLDTPAPCKRTVVLQLNVPAGHPNPQGIVNVQSYSPTQEDQRPINKDIELEGNQVSFKAYIGGRFSYRPKRIVGVTFQEGRVENVSTGEKPLVVEVNAIPSGAIAGRVLDKDGRAPRGHVSIKPEVVRKPSQMNELPGFEIVDPNSTRTQINPVDGTFMVTPLPLGGQYRLVANKSQYYLLSEPVTVDEAHPLPKVELRMRDGINMAVRVLGPGGRPLENIPVEFRYELEGGSSGSYSPPEQTDDKGMVIFENLNPAAGKYFANLNLRKDYQPVDVQLGTVDDPAVVQLKPGHVLEGRVIEAETGYPIPNVKVYAHPEDWNLGEKYRLKPEGPTDAQGRFRFSNLQDRSYEIGATEGVRELDRVIAKPNGDKPLELRVEIASWSKLSSNAPTTKATE